jgi:hypothetical protein
MPTPIAVATIVAQAFRYMEVTPPSSLDDDSQKARDAAEQYPNALLQCLEASDWSFASVIVSLPAAALPGTVASDPDLPYFYRLPGDLVTIQEVGDGLTKWRRDREGLRADAVAPLRLRYTGTIINEASLSATFRDAVALTLACLLAPIWLTTDSKQQRIDAQRERALKKAIRQDARTASDARYDGLPDQGDWASEATL